MHGLKNVFVGIAFATTLLSSVTTACTVKAMTGPSESKIIVYQGDKEIGSLDNMQCVVSEDPNMIDAGLDHKVAVYISCDTQVSACSVDYGDQKGLEGTVETGYDMAQCNVEFDCGSD